jgi:hypothetical protein
MDFIVPLFSSSYVLWWKHILMFVVIKSVGKYSVLNLEIVLEDQTITFYWKCQDWETQFINAIPIWSSLLFLSVIVLSWKCVYLC